MLLLKLFLDKEGNELDTMQYAELCENKEYRRIGIDIFEDESYLSTIWTGIDGHGNGEIFETVYFPINGSVKILERYRTEQEAINGHGEFLKEIKEKLDTI